jgi:hypothetical protein
MSEVLRVGLENNVEGRSLAWALAYPGCFAYGANADEALANLPAGVQDYVNLIGQEMLPATLADLAIKVEETWEVYAIDEQYERAAGGYEVNAWFLYDWKPLSSAEVDFGLKILARTREVLLDSVSGSSQAQLSEKQAGERWNILGILRHVGGAEWWYLDRLGLAFKRAELPGDPFERLASVRARLVEVLPDLAGSTQVVGVEGEFWSPRKVLRRAAWHERDHTEHIRKLLRGGASGTG